MSAERTGIIWEFLRGRPYRTSRKGEIVLSRRHQWVSRALAKHDLEKDERQEESASTLQLQYQG